MRERNIDKMKERTANDLYYMGLFGILYSSILTSMHEMRVAETEEKRKEIVDDTFEEFMSIVRMCAERMNEKGEQK